VADLAFNVLLVPLDVVVWVVAARSDRPARTARIAAVCWLLAALVVAAVFQQGLFHTLRLYAYIMFAHLPVILIGIGGVLRKDAWKMAVLAVAGAAVLWAIAIDAFLIEPHSLEVSTVEVRSDKVSRRIRIAVASDLQTDRIGEYERHALQAVLDARPDLILLPGDYLHVPPEDQDRLAAELRSLLIELDFGAPLGAYAVQGNTDWNEWSAIFAGTRVTPLPRLTNLSLGELDLTGLGFVDSFNTRLRIDGSDRFHVVFGHSPDFALGEVQADLLVAGHTHGGQVRLPLLGPIVTFSAVPRAWAAGMTRLSGGRTLVVSRGIGMERGRAPRLRFLCRPEIVIIDVVPEDEHP
jgi:predicted MPP superfamily phosphohydrolase